MCHGIKSYMARERCLALAEGVVKVPGTVSFQQR